MADKKFSVTRNGKPLDPSLYTWDEETQTFSTTEENLLLDFSEYSNCTFKTGSNCTFKTGSNCTFVTGWGCTFDTGSDCTFDTGSNCTFVTGSDCTFDTGSNCTFDTGWDCTFVTGWDCTFVTGSGCTFVTGSDCVIVRRGVLEYFSPQKERKYHLAPENIPGYIMDGYYYKDGKKQYKAIIADGILSEILSEKKSKNLIIFKVKNYNQDK